jgi:hypothetical protein
MNPVIAHFQTLFAAMRTGLDIPNLIEVCASCHQRDLLIRFNLRYPAWSRKMPSSAADRFQHIVRSLCRATSERDRMSSVFFAETEKAFGKLDVLVNNAGVSGGLR